MPAFWRRKRFWGTLLAVGFLIWCLYDLDLHEVGLIVRRLHYGWLTLSMVVVIAVLWVRSARWRVLINPMKAISGARMFSIYAVGQMANLVLPGLTGQAVRVMLLHRAEGVTKTGAVSTVVLETLLDGLSLVLFMMGASAALVLPDWLERGERWGLLVILAFLVLVVAVVQLRDRVGSLLRRFEARLPQPVYVRVDRVWNNFSAGLASLRSMRHLTLSFFLSVASWLGNLAIISLLLVAFGFTLPAGAALVLMIVNTVLLLVPVTPGNVGTYQVACVLGLSLFGVEKTDAVSYGLVLHIVTFIPIAIVGLYHYLRNSFTEAKPEDGEGTVEEA